MKRRVYGDKKSVHSGPMCTGMTVNHEGKAVLSFEAGTDKLWAVDELKGFAIAGADGHFQWAEAVVVNGNQVAVWHKDIPHPVTVRYGWDDNPVHANLKIEPDYRLLLFRFHWKINNLTEIRKWQSFLIIFDGF